MEIPLCMPALIFFVFVLTQIILDLFYGFINTAAMKGIIMVVVTLLLNVLCKNGLSIVSWIIVFIPFIFMSVIIALLLYSFGLSPDKGGEGESGNLVYSQTYSS